MTRATECPILGLPRTRKTVAGRLYDLLGGLLKRGAGRPTQIQPEDLSRYMLKDIGLDGCSLGGGATAGRSLMDWPRR